MRRGERDATLRGVSRDQLEARLATVRGRIEEAAGRAGRDPAAVEVLPITKGHPAYYVRHVAEVGLPAVGENRVGEAEEKRELLAGDLGLRWHMVGQLPARQAARAVRLFQSVESVDSVELAGRLSREAERADVSALEVLVQVNTSGEKTKGGLGPEEAPSAVAQMADLPALRVAGLMTMAPLTDDADVLRRTFRGARELLERCAGTEGFEARVLSMGMSNDFEIAVEEGATRVRLGTVLLGERPQ